MKVFYHSADNDGRACAAIARYFNPACELIPINYGDVFPWTVLRPNEHVLMVDFSLQPFSDMVKLNRLVELVWIDHHVSAIRDFEAAHEQIAGVRDTRFAACELVWRYLAPPDSVIPYAIKLLGRYDVWDHSNPDVLPFQAGMQFRDCNPEFEDLWRPLLEDRTGEGEDFLTILHTGSTIEEYERQQRKIRASATAFPLEFEGCRFIAANVAVANSRLFDSVWDPVTHDAMLLFYWSRKGFWTVRMYTERKDVDLSLIAKKYGGGGHAGACGFQCAELPFRLPVKES